MKDDLLPTEIGDGFVSETAAVNGTVLHYVRGGAAPTVLLIHGFPEDWYEWRFVMPRLARRYSVVAVDLRGVGGSAAPATGYDAAGMATDVAALVDRLGVGPVYVVGHDIGGWVAYALARLRPDLARSVIIMEVFLPGIQPTDAPPVEVPLWHGEFHRVPDLPETLVQGREAAYVGGDQVFGPGMPPLAKHLRTEYGWTNAQAAIVTGRRHHLPEEHPAEIADLIERHAQAAMRR